MHLTTVSELDLDVSKLGRLMQVGQRVVMQVFLATAVSYDPGHWLYLPSDDLGVFQLQR